MGVARIHQETYWYRQFFNPHNSSYKAVFSFLIAITTMVPMVVLFQSIVSSVAWVIIALSGISTLANILVIRAITRQQGAPYLVFFVVQTMIYAIIGSLAWGTADTIEHLWVGVVAFVSSVGCLASIIVLWMPRHTADESIDAMNIYEIFGLIVLTITAIAIRLYSIDSVPIPRNLEAVYTLYSQYLQRTVLVNPITFGIDGTSPLISQIQSTFLGVIGGGISALRVASALLGSATIIAVYVATRIFFDRRTAWLTSLALMAMSVHVEFSRLAIPYVADSVLLCGVLAVLASGWQTGKRRWYIVAGVLLGLSQYTYHTGKIIPVIYALWIALLALQNWNIVDTRLRQLASMWFTATVVALPMWVNIALQWDIYWGLINQVSMLTVQPALGQSWLSYTATNTQSAPWAQLLYQIRDATAAFVVVPLRDGYDVGIPMLTIPSAVLFTIGILLMIREYDDPRYWLLFIGLASAIGVAAITIDTPAAQRMVYITPFVAIIIGIGLAESGRWFRLEWIQADWSINPLIIQTISIALAIAIAGYDGYTYISNTGTQSASVEEQSASAISERIRTYPNNSRAYLFTAPVLMYNESALLSLQAPQVSGIDVYPPLAEAPNWVLDAPVNVFVFTPDRIGEMNIIRRYYPGGSESRAYRSSGELLVIFYEVPGINQPPAP